MHDRQPAHTVHDAQVGDFVDRVFRVDGPTTLVEIDGARTVVSRAGMPDPNVTVDTVGLTLWRDGFAGETPSVRADVEFHAVAVLELTFVPKQLMRLFPAVFGDGR